MNKRLVGKSMPNSSHKNNDFIGEKAVIILRHLQCRFAEHIGDDTYWSMFEEENGGEYALGTVI